MSHDRDEDCTLDASDDCIDCGVSHGDPCATCDGRGFHRPCCPGLYAVGPAEYVDWRGTLPVRALLALPLMRSSPSNLLTVSIAALATGEATPATMQAASDATREREATAAR